MILRRIRPLAVAAVLGLVPLVSAASAPSAHAALPTCNGVTWFADEVGGLGFSVKAPSRNGSPDCLLRSGNSGSAVKALQRTLYYYYYKHLGISAANISRDGVFGPATAKALRAAQSRHNLTADGIYGPKTRDKLCWVNVESTQSYSCGAGRYFQ